MMIDLRHDWYQKQDSITVVFYISKVEPDSVQLRFDNDNNNDVDQKNAVLLTFQKIGDDTVYTKNLSFYGPVQPDQSKVSINPTNISITLPKTTEHWPHLWHTPIVSTASAEHPPKYPSSSKKKTDWDRIASDTVSEETARTKDQQSVDDFFKQIYQNASEETRRAMNKSFIESKGTVLSTNWSEVGSKPVTPKAP